MGFLNTNQLVRRQSSVHYSHCIQRKRGDSPGSDPAFVSMTTLRGLLSGSSLGFLSRVMSSLYFHKAFLVRTQKSNKANTNDYRGLSEVQRDIVSVSWGDHTLQPTAVKRKECKDKSHADCTETLCTIITYQSTYPGSTVGGSGVHSRPSSAQTESHGEPCWQSCLNISGYSG